MLRRKRTVLPAHGTFFLEQRWCSSLFYVGWWEYLQMVKPTVWFCLCPENEAIEETKHQRYKDVSHSFLDLKRDREHSRHKRSTGEVPTEGPEKPERPHI